MNAANRFRGEVVSAFVLPQNLPGDPILIGENVLVTLNQRGQMEGKTAFQSLGIYELRTQKLVRRIRDAFIFVANEDEYVIVDDDKLIGPSDMHVHFLVYSLTSGQLLRRLRASHSSSILTRVTSPAPRVLSLNTSLQPPHSEAPLSKSQTAPGLSGDSLADPRPQVAAKSPTTLPPIGGHQQQHDAPGTTRAPISNRPQPSDPRATTLTVPVPPPIEREPPIEQLVVSESGRVMVVAYNTHFLNVFDLQLIEHTFAMLSSCILSLACSSLTYTGTNLSHEYNVCDATVLCGHSNGLTVKPPAHTIFEVKVQSTELAFVSI